MAFSFGCGQRENEKSDEYAVPMERGKSRIDSLQQSLSVSSTATWERSIGQLTAKLLDQTLFGAMTTISQQALRRWRQNYVKENAGATVEQMLEAARAAALPTMKKRKTRNVGSTIVGDLEEHARKKRHHDAFMQDLERIKESKDIGVECQICFEMFVPEHTLHCLANDEHVICRPCFVSYCRANMPSATIETLVCPMCKTSYDRCVLEVNLPPDVLDDMDRKQIELDRKVALASGVEAVLYCECGIVAVIEASDVGDSVVACTCGHAYCVRCGNFAHSGQLCPTPRETIKWLDKHGKLCPNCGEGIEKNGGCKHMTCRSCKHEFCWNCVGKWPRCLCNRS